MFGIETIKAMNAAAGRKARAKRMKPRKIASIEKYLAADIKKKSIPFLGTACRDVDATHERIDTLFVDISGFGSPYERALTFEQMTRKFGELIKQHGPIMVALEEHGQFQGYVAVWHARTAAERAERTARKAAKKAAKAAAEPPAATPESPSATVLTLPSRPARYPKPTTRRPSEEELEELVMDSVCDATDGCTVEPDGTCEHGHVSWLIYLGYM